jgi:hypothetical protein
MAATSYRETYVECRETCSGVVRCDDFQAIKSIAGLGLVRSGMSDEEKKQSHHCEAFVIFANGPQITRDVIKAHGEQRKYRNDAGKCHDANDSVTIVSKAA